MGVKRGIKYQVDAVLLFQKTPADENPPERFVRDGDDLSHQAPGDVLTLGGVSAGDVDDLLRQACGEGDEYPEERVTQGRRPRYPVVGPSLQVRRVIFPRLAQVVAEAPAITSSRST